MVQMASGADAYLLHVTTTPSVAYVARVDEFDCGIMISASHNPYFDNGIKLINGNGEKMDEETISLVEAYLDGNLEVFGQKWEEIPFAKKEKIGCTVDYVSGRNRYIGYLISLGVYSFRGVKVALAPTSTTMPVLPISEDCRNTWWRMEWTLVLPMTVMQTAVSA